MATIQNVAENIAPSLEVLLAAILTFVQESVARDIVTMTHDAIKTTTAIGQDQTTPIFVSTKSDSVI